MDQDAVAVVVAASSECRQYLEWQCFSASLVNQFNGDPITFWYNSDGEQREYWGDVAEEYVSGTSTYDIHIFDE